MIFTGLVRQNVDDGILVEFGEGLWIIEFLWGVMMLKNVYM